MTQKLYRAALREAIDEEMERDHRVFCIGEDIGNFGGSFRVTEGLLDKWGEERIVDTPISEEVIVGCGIGAAMAGLRPVVELMTVNFSLVAYDQIVNSAAHIRYMFGGQITVPMTIRMPGGAGHQLGAQHSHSFEALYGQIPGLLVVAPATPADAKGLLKSAIRADNPVIVLENEGLYGMKGEVPDGEVLTPIGTAEVKREGADLTIVTLSRMVGLSLLAAQRLEEEDVDVEVVDLRSIRPIDWAALAGSVTKTGRCVIVEEGWPTYGVSAEIAAGLQERAFDSLDAPILRLGGAEVPMPYNKQLEQAALPQVDDIVALALRCVGKRGGDRNA